MVRMWAPTLTPSSSEKRAAPSLSGDSTMPTKSYSPSTAYMPSTMVSSVSTSDVILCRLSESASRFALPSGVRVSVRM